MKKNHRSWLYPIILLGLVLFITSSCDKDDEETPTNTVSDADGNVYKTVTIGTQTWMAENLKTTKYNDGTSIPLVTDNAAWDNLTTPGYCWYNNNEAANKTTYGALYNWYTVNTGKLAPTGWHVPTDAEWKTLEIYLGMTIAQADEIAWRGTDQGTQLKNTSGWNSGGNGTNTSGFAGLPGGSRQQAGAFDYIGNYGSWCVSTEKDDIFVWGREVSNDQDNVFRGYSYKQWGFSVRCVKDN